MDGLFRLVLCRYKVLIRKTHGLVGTMDLSK